MGVVSLKEKGLLFEDDFSTGISTSWEIVPNDPTRVIHNATTNTVSLKHGTETIFMFLPDLTNQKQFVLDLKNVYNPETDADIGGLVVYADQDDFIGLEEFFDTASGTTQSYPWLRLVRDYNNYYGYWSEDGVTWHLIGSNYFDRLAPKIGIFLEGETGNDLNIEEIKVTKSSKVTVKNLSEGTKVSLIDSSNNVIEEKVCKTHDNKVIFDVSDRSIPFSAKFVVDTGVGILDDNRYLDIIGGDVYNFEVSPDLIFYKEDNATPIPIYLDSGIEEFLGYLNANAAGYQDSKLVIDNKFAGVFNDVLITLSPYNGTDHYQRLVELAPDNNGSPGTFSDSVSFSQIDSGTSQTFWARLKREYDPAKYTTEVYFGLNVGASYNI